MGRTTNGGSQAGRIEAVLGISTAYHISVQKASA
jgi:hypothetical protein